MKYLEVCLQISIFAPLFNRKHNEFVLWCNGSTTVFGSVCLSSNLGRTTFFQLISYKNPQNMQFCGFFCILK